MDSGIRLVQLPSRVPAAHIRKATRRHWPVMRGVLLAIAIVLLAACSGEPGTGPVEVKWDRDVCTRCNMVLSDRHHAAQIRYTPTDGSRGMVAKFDDLGCAVLWLDQQAWKDQSGVEIWVTDYRDGGWIDARTAQYVVGQYTPMQFGLGAQIDETADSMNFAAAREHIYRIERRFNTHGSHLEHDARPPTK